MNDLYEKVLDDANSKFKNAVIQDLQSDDFNWYQLIELLLIEDSALQDVFSNTTLQSAGLCKNAMSLHQSYTELEG